MQLSRESIHSKHDQKFKMMKYVRINSYWESEEVHNGLHEGET